VFTPSTVPLTTTSQGATESQVELLLAQSNRFIDNSTNNFTVTRNGDTRIDAFDPFVPDTNYSAYGSGYFDGTGDYLTVPANAGFQFGTGDFTIECWIYKSSAANGPIVDARGSSVAAAYAAYIDGSNFPYFYDGTSYTSSVAITNGQWNHVAFVRTSGTLKMFVNGVQGYSATLSSTLSPSQTVFIGGHNFATPAYTTGYISNLRIVNGTAVYTSAFTPPTTPLTAVANTSLLTLQTNQPDNNNILLDSSTNNFLITRNGNTTQGTFSPYGPLWSNYFDGTGDYLSMPSNSAFAFGTGSYTVEAWVYFTAWDGNESNVFGSASASGGFSLSVYPTGRLSVSKYGTGNILQTNTGLINLNTWYHIAASRTSTSSNSTYLFINGTLVTTGTDAENWSVSSSPIIGGWSNLTTYDVTGYISNLRVVKGTALYTANFTPSTSPLTAVANTSLLTCNENRFIDDSPNNFTITRNGDVNVQRFSPFGLQTLNTFYSGYFDGTGDYLSLASNTAFAAPGDFTVEFWVNTPTTASSQVFYLVNATNGLIVYVTSNKVVIRSYGIANLLTSSIDMPLNQWVHIAAARSGTTLSLWINGSRSNGGTVTNSTSFAQGELRIGNNEDVTLGTIGYISNVRFVKGTAVYDPAQSSITVPTSPLTAIANTSLLTCQSATFVDNSTNNFTITVNGNSRPTTVAPFTPTSTTGVSYSPSVYGGSMYFDGSGDYLTVPPSTTTYLSNRAFTIEAWVYLNANDVILVSRRAAVSARGFFFSYGNVTNNKFSFNAGDTDVNAWNVQLTSTDTFSLRQWHHVAITRNSSNVFTLWVNGISQATGTASFTIADDTSNLLIGTVDSGSGPMNGYISNLRIITGQALYTSNFAPPVSPLTAIQNSVLLLNGTSAGVYDSSMMNDYETVGNSSLVTSIKKYGNSSLYFDGSGDYLTSLYIQSQEPGSSNLTWEMWIKTTSSLQYATLYSRQPGTFTSGMYSLLINSASSTAGDVALWVADFSAGGPLLQTTGVNVRDDNWHHIAVVRNGSSWVLYVDGTSRSTGTWSGAIAALSTPTRIGADQNYGRAYTGYMGDLRITRGIARYTANFTPTTLPFITK
jgi:hypothetical protein